MNENSGYKDLDDDIVELLQKFDNMVNSSNYSYVDYDDCIVILDSYIYLGEINKAKIALDYFVSLHPGKKSLSETVFRLNCEAAEEIARQLRLRDVGGIVLIDFIDMDSPQEREALLEQLRAALKADRNRTNVLGMTALGLVEMTRKKTRQPLNKLLMRDCSACLASGREWTHESVAYRAVREIWRRRRMGDTTAYAIRTGEKVAGWIGTIGLPEGGRTVLDPCGSDASYEILPCDGARTVAGSEEEV